MQQEAALEHRYGKISEDEMHIFFEQLQHKHNKLLIKLY